MANEISLVTSLSITSGTLSRIFPAVTQQITQATPALGDFTQSIATTSGGVALAIPAGVATLGIASIKNLDATNYVELGVVVSATFYPVNRFKATEEYKVRLVPGVSYYMRANTATVSVQVVVLDD